MDLEPEVVVVGGGPVGLVLAHALGARGVRTLIVERRLHPPARSMAIGITPPSLEILRELGLVEQFISRGVQIKTAKVFENRRVLGELEFGGVSSKYPYILSLPQSVTVELLEAGLARWTSVVYRRGVECLGVEEHGKVARIKLEGSRGRQEVHARWVVGCDGHRSTVRQAAGIQLDSRDYPASFMMADFVDGTGWGDEARVFFGSSGAVESFPLPQGQRRWIVQLSEEMGEVDRFVELVRARTGHDPGGNQVGEATVFQPKRAEAQVFFRGPVVLCGDAAHVMSPIGGQGMNTGLGDAALLARCLGSGLSLTEYERVRRRAFRRSAGRTARGMWLGTRRGSGSSRGRRLLIARVLFHPSVKPKLAGWFAMLPDFTMRACDREEMDAADCCPETLLRTVRQFTSINRWLSRYRVIMDRLILADMQKDPKRDYQLVDLGAGGCDIAVWALQQARRLGLRLRVTAVELDPRIAAYARAAHENVEGLTVRCMDARDLSELGPVDYVFANHFLHHLDDEQAVEVLGAIGAVVKRRAVLSDLHRSRASYLGFGVLAACLYHRSFTLRDGLLSIRKGFVMSDLLDLARRAGLWRRATVKRFLPGRIVLSVTP